MTVTELETAKECDLLDITAYIDVMRMRIEAARAREDRNMLAFRAWSARGHIVQVACEWTN